MPAALVACAANVRHALFSPFRRVCLHPAASFHLVQNLWLPEMRSFNLTIKVTLHRLPSNLDPPGASGDVWNSRSLAFALRRAFCPRQQPIEGVHILATKPPQTLDFIVTTVDRFAREVQCGSVPGDGRNQLSPDQQNWARDGFLRSGIALLNTRRFTEKVHIRWPRRRTQY